MEREAGAEKAWGNTARLGWSVQHLFHCSIPKTDSLNTQGSDVNPLLRPSTWLLVTSISALVFLSASRWKEVSYQHRHTEMEEQPSQVEATFIITSKGALSKVTGPTGHLPILGHLAIPGDSSGCHSLGEQGKGQGCRSASHSAQDSTQPQVIGPQMSTALRLGYQGLQDKKLCPLPQQHRPIVAEPTCPMPGESSEHGASGAL